MRLTVLHLNRDRVVRVAMPLQRHHQQRFFRVVGRRHAGPLFIPLLVLTNNGGRPDGRLGRHGQGQKLARRVLDLVSDSRDGLRLFLVSHVHLGL